MIGSVERYSSSVRRRRVSLLGSRTFRILLIAFILYLVVSRFIVATFSRARFPGLTLPERGDLVVVQPPFYNDEPALVRFFQPIVSFLTLQKASLRRDLYGSRVNSYMLKRIIGMPGDTIRLSNYKIWIRPQGASDFVAEDQLVPAHYTTLAGLNAPGWDSSLPFSGNEGELLLRDREYYVMGDNRPESSDSRSWGPVSTERIIGKAIYRYWPPRSIGKL